MREFAIILVATALLVAFFPVLFVVATTLLFQHGVFASFLGIVFLTAGALWIMAQLG
jgi:hypothetical protein